MKTGFADKRDAAMLVAAETALFAVFSPVIYLMGIELWRTDSLSQNLLFPVIACVLLYVRRGEVFDGLRWRDWRGAAVAVAAMFVYVAGVRMGMVTTARVAALAAMFGCAMFFAGAGAVRRGWGPVLLLFMMVPWPVVAQNMALQPWLEFDRRVTSEVAVWLSRIAGAHAWREGIYIYVPGGRLSMDIRCTGINYVINLCVITIVLAYIARGGCNRKAALAVCAPVAGFAANAARVAMNVVVANYMGASAGFAFFHNAGGIFFAVAAALMMAGAARLCGLRFADTAAAARAKSENTDAGI